MRKSIRAVIGAAAAASLSFGILAAADWPQWRGPNRDGKSTETGLVAKFPEGGPKLLWSKTDISDIGTGYGCPAIVGGKLYILGADGAKQDAKEFLTCLDAATGKAVWKIDLTTTGGKFLDGWGGGPRGTPTVDGSNIYVIGATGDLTCATTGGKVVWTKNLVKDFGGAVPQWGYSESVLIDGDKLLCTPGNKGGITALDKKTGNLIWTCKELTDGAGYSSLIVTEVGGVKQYVTQTMAHGVGVRAKDGKLLWSVGEIKRSVAVIPTPVIKDGHVFFTTGYGGGCELFKLEADGEGTKATLVYKSGLVVNHHGGVVEVNGKLYGHSDAKSVWFCLDFLKDGKEALWTSNKLDKGSISFADGQLYCYGQGKGTLVRIMATDTGWEETGRFTIPELSSVRPRQGLVWAHPVVANGKLYLRDYEKFFCYDISGGKAN